MLYFYRSGSYDDNDRLYVVEEPEVDAESLALYKESVYHTYEPDRQFYVDYLSNDSAS